MEITKEEMIEILKDSIYCLEKDVSDPHHDIREYENLDEEISQKIEFVIYEDEKHGRPSTIVDLTGEEAVVKER